MKKFKKKQFYDNNGITVVAAINIVYVDEIANTCFTLWLYIMISIEIDNNKSITLDVQLKYVILKTLI